MKHTIGQSIPRREDQRLLTGNGRYIDDINLHNQAHAYFVRSPHAHARIVAVEKTEAAAVPGVLAVYCARDLAAEQVGPLRYPVSIKNFDGSDIVAPVRPALAEDRARHVGDPVAMIVAKTPQIAREAADLISVDYETLPAVMDTARAMADGAPLLWDKAAKNTSFVWEAGDRNATDKAFATASHVTRLTLEHNRLAAAPIEPRGAIGEFDSSSNRYVLHASIQDPQSVHAVVSQHGLKVDGSRLRVTVPDVGGGFGMKNFAYPELVLLPWAARKLRRPVKWFADRSESFVSDDQGRGHESEAELALDKDGRFLAIRVRFTSNVGAYLSTSGSRITTVVGSRCITGAYMIPVAHVVTRGVFTNMTPSGSYRGAGKPEFIYVLERIVDLAARELKVDPIELRARNLIPSSAMPYRNAIGDTIDNGDVAKNVTDALRIADRNGFSERKLQARAAGKLRGFGVAVYMEHEGLRDGRARVTFDTTGAVTVAVTAQSNGQGHETTFAQIAADRLGLPMENVAVIQGDTDRTGFGGGTGGSRSVTVCGSAIVQAADKIVAKGKRIAAYMLKADPGQIEFADGIFRLEASNQTVDIASVARTSYMVQNMPRDEELGLEATGHFGGHVPNFSNGCHICEIEIDAETGTPEIVNYVAVDDFGQVINPMLAAGQVHGGIAQGISQALYEACVYDGETGQLLTGSFMDYCLPRAESLPAFTCAMNRTETTTNLLSVKGCGETGTTAAPPAVMNAIVDALSEFGVHSIDMPATSEKLWRAIHHNRG